MVWLESPPGESDPADFVLYGGLHGPDDGPRVPVRVEGIWEIQGKLERDPDLPHDGVRRRRGKQERVTREYVPARLACDLHEGTDWPSPATMAVALKVSPIGPGEA